MEEKGSTANDHVWSELLDEGSRFNFFLLIWVYVALVVSSL